MEKDNILTLVKYIIFSEMITQFYATVSTFLGKTHTFPLWLSEFTVVCEFISAGWWNYMYKEKGN